MSKKEQTKKILLVETEAIIAIELQMRLELNGYDVRFVSTAEKALELLKNYNPDLIITAIILSGTMDGIELASIIRKRKNISLIYLTSLSYMKNDLRLMETQPVGVLSKPVLENDLFEMINTALNKSPISSDNV